MIHKNKSWFPSPVGELHFSISKALTFRYRENHVSVPCRGTTFLNLKKLSVENYKKVSVPCRGTTFLNLPKSIKYAGELSFRPLSGNYISQWDCKCGYNGVMWFPSPVGELHFSIVNEIHNDCKNFSKVSVPCRGTTFLNWKKKSKEQLTQSFRPLSGNYISQFLIKWISQRHVGFRPLSGNYISQFNTSNQKPEQFEFPSPVGELHFSM